MSLWGLPFCWLCAGLGGQFWVPGEPSVTLRALLLLRLAGFRLPAGFGRRGWFWQVTLLGSDGGRDVAADLPGRHTCRRDLVGEGDVPAHSPPQGAPWGEPPDEDQ